MVVATGCLSTAVLAKDIRIAPSTVEPGIGSNTATLNILNGENDPLKVQIRVMRWSEEGGHDVLSPTKDLVASPPFVTLQPNGRYTVRLVRTAKTQLHGEESYRVLVDEVPQPHTVQPGTVNFVLRQSVPVFFSNDPNRAAKVNWSLVRDGQNLWLVGHNSGNRRLRLSDVTLDANGSAVYQQAGLLGYVLAESEVRWPVATNRALPANAKLELKATTDAKAIDVPLEVAPGR